MERNANDDTAEPLNSHEVRSINLAIVPSCEALRALS